MQVSCEDQFLDCNSDAFTRQLIGRHHYIEKEAKDLIKKLICKPEKRLTAQEALEHKWFRKALKGENTKKIKLTGK